MDRNARLAAWSGIGAVILLMVGFGLFTSGQPGYNEGSDQWAAWLGDHQDRIRVGIALITVGLFLFLWFAGTLRSAIALAEGGSSRLATIAVGSAVAGATLLMIGVSAGATAAFRPVEIDPQVTRAMTDFGALLAGPGAAAFTAFSAAVAIGGYRHGALPAPIAGFFALSAITQPLAIGVIFTDKGVFAADGVLGAYIPVITFSLAVATASWVLARGFTPGTGSTA